MTLKTKKLQELEVLIQAKSDEVTEIFNHVDEHMGGEIDPERKDQVIKTNKEIEELEKQALEEQQMGAIRQGHEARQARNRRPVNALNLPGGGAERAKTRRPISLGEEFVGSALWQDYIARIAPNGQVSATIHVDSPGLLLNRSILNLITGTDDDSAGAFVVPDQSGIYETLGRRPLTLRDIISVRTTASDLIEYVRMTSRTNNAAPVAEATSEAGSSGYKPMSDMEFDRLTAAVKTIANWVPATKRSLSDAGQMRGIINQELLQNLEEELEDQILNGSGVGENMEGLDTVSGTQDQAWSTNILTTTRKARTLTRTVGRVVPTAYLLNPTDWETIDLLQDNEARYYFGGPSVLGNPRLWGLPVVESEAQTVGFGWVGDFRKIVLWDREQATIQVSDSHQDFFVRNLVAILAEMRAALGITRPSAFVEMDLTA